MQKTNTDNSTQSPPTDVEEVLETSTFAAFPNPVKGRLTIELDMKTNSTLQIELLSIDGKRQLNIARELGVGPQQLYLDLSTFSSGLYFLNVIHDGDQISRKIVVE